MLCLFVYLFVCLFPSLCICLYVCFQRRDGSRKIIRDGKIFTKPETKRQDKRKSVHETFFSAYYFPPQSRLWKQKTNKKNYQGCTEQEYIFEVKE